MEDKNNESPILSAETVESLDDEIEKENIKKVEAALFVAGRFLSIPELITLTDVNPILLRKIQMISIAIVLGSFLPSY